MPQGQFPAILAGQDYVASLLQSMVGFSAWKTTQTSRASTTTLANDPDLFIPIGANQTFFFVAQLNYTGDATGSGGFKWTFTTPSGSTLTWSQLYAPSSASSVQTSGSGTGSGQTRSAVTNGTAQMTAWCLGAVLNGSASGDLQLQWAQNASDTTATVVTPGSFLYAVRGA